VDNFLDIYFKICYNRSMKEITMNYKDIVKRFNSVESEFIGDYIRLCYAVKGCKFSRKDLRNAFLKLVSRDEYDFVEREEYIIYLSSI